MRSGLIVTAAPPFSARPSDRWLNPCTLDLPPSMISLRLLTR